MNLKEEFAANNVLKNSIQIRYTGRRHDGVITHLEPDILECEAKCGLSKHHYEQS